MRDELLYSPYVSGVLQVKHAVFPALIENKKHSVRVKKKPKSHEESWLVGSIHYTDFVVTFLAPFRVARTERSFAERYIRLTH